MSNVTVHPDDCECDLLTIGQVFFPNDGSGTSSEAFFNDQARNLFLGIGLYLLETPELPRTIGEMLRQSSGKGQTLKEHFGDEITPTLPMDANSSWTSRHCSLSFASWSGRCWVFRLTSCEKNRLRSGRALARRFGGIRT